MLVLRRKVGEGIVIGKNLIVRVLSIERGDVKLGIEAPKDVKILREELYDEVVNTNVQASEFDLSRVHGIFKSVDKDEIEGGGGENEDHR